MKLVRSIGGDVNRFPRPHGRLGTAKGCFHFALEKDERFFEVVPVRRRSATRRDVHIDQAILTRGVPRSEQGGIGIPHQADVRHPGRVWIYMGQIPLRIISRDA